MNSYNRLRLTKVLKVDVETPTVKTLSFKDGLCARAKPGQFVMIWAPGVDEVPMSISRAFEGGASITVERVGEATEALHKLKAGDFIGVRGPFGTYFTPSRGSALIVAGGTGAAPLAFLAERLVKSARRVSFLLGAKSQKELLFLDRLRKASANVEVVAITEDGSYGLKGLVTDGLSRLIEEGGFDVAYTCGPELMMYKVFLTTEEHGLPLQASLERLMRCAIGICGSCAIGKYLVCKDGPVFTSDKLREVRDEFGRFKRSIDGRRVSINVGL